MRVAVMPDDYGFDPVAGELVTATAHEVAVRRDDAELGEVVVHFPRIGFQIRARRSRVRCGSAPASGRRRLL